MCYLAKLMLDAIQRQIEDMHTAYEQGRSRPEECPNLPALVDDTDKLCVMIAALGHDTGHGPKSHLFELVAKECFSANTDKEEWNHEAMSVKMVGLMVEEGKGNESEQVVCEGMAQLRALTENDMRFIYECILGKDLSALPGGQKKKYSEIECQRAWKGRERDKFYLYDIVSNIFSGLDTDKMDYLMRDPNAIAALEMRENLSNRAKVFVQLCRRAQVRWCKPVQLSEGGSGDVGGEGRWGITYPSDMKDTVNLLFRQRQDMHENVYNHPSVKTFERHYLKIFKESLKLKFDQRFKPKNEGDEDVNSKSFTEAMSCPNTFAFLNDSVVSAIGLHPSTSAEVSIRASFSSSPSEYLKYPDLQ